LFRYGEGVVDLDPKIANGTFDLCVSKEQLHGTQVAGTTINECRFGSAERMRSEEAGVKPNGANPLGDQPRVLPRCHAPIAATAARKEELAGLFAGRSEIRIERLTCLLRQLEPDWPSRLFLPHGCAIDGMPVWRHIFHFQADHIAAAEFAVNCEIEHRQVALSAFDLQFGAD